MKTMKFFVPIIAIAMFVSCGPQTANERVSENNFTVLTYEERANLTPDDVIALLKQGNREFVRGYTTVRNSPDVIRASAEGQFPMAVILSCLDSRVPVEDVFHRGIGDLFVGRVAGNIVNVDLLGSMEFACAAAGAKVIMVLGHGACGAVIHAMNDTRLGNITEMLSKIRPAVGNHTNSDDLAQLKAVTVENVKLQVRNIRAGSEILRGMEETGAIRIIGGYYCMHTGQVEFFTNI